MSNPQSPTIDARRAMLTQKRDNFRNLAYDAEIEVVAVSSQSEGVTEAERAKAVEELTAKATNCYASAAALDALLSKLPTSNAEKK